jgi:hypothetical protein
MFDLEFTPQSDEAIDNLKTREDEERLLSDGEGRFDVITCAAKVSKSGNNMLCVKLKVWDCNNKSGFIDEYLMTGEKSFFIRRIKSFCDSIGIIDKYNSGKLNASDINNSHNGKIIIGRRKDNNGKLQNTVTEYIKKSEDKNTINEDLNDDIPWLNQSYK